MNFFIQIIVSGLTFGAMYALAAVGLALVWGAFNMLNMAHGIIMTLGAYFVLVWAELFGLPLWFAGPFAFLAGGIVGAVIYFISAHWMLTQKNFEVTIIIATFGLGMALEAGLMKLLRELFQAAPYAQPLSPRRRFVPRGRRPGQLSAPYHLGGRGGAHRPRRTLPHPHDHGARHPRDRAEPRRR